MTKIKTTEDIKSTFKTHIDKAYAAYQSAEKRYYNSKTRAWEASEKLNNGIDPRPEKSMFDEFDIYPEAEETPEEYVANLDKSIKKYYDEMEEYKERLRVLVDLAWDLDMWHNEASEVFYGDN